MKNTTDTELNNPDTSHYFDLFYSKEYLRHCSQKEQRKKKLNKDRKKRPIRKS